MPNPLNRVPEWVTTPVDITLGEIASHLCGLSGGCTVAELIGFQSISPWCSCFFLLILTVVFCHYVHNNIETRIITKKNSTVLCHSKLFLFSKDIISYRQFSQPLIAKHASNKILRKNLNTNVLICWRWSRDAINWFPVVSNIYFTLIWNLCSQQEDNNM